MKRIIDGKNAVMGRLASYAAKQALKGEEIVILNCNEVIITGNRKSIKEEFLRRRKIGGSSQKGPLLSKSSEKLVKKVIRGMLPDHRWGVGKAALGRIRCYNAVPKEFENEKKISAGREKGVKFVKVEDIMR